MYLEAILLFILNQLPQEQHSLYEAYTFLSRMGREALDDIITEEIITHPNSAFARKIGMIRQNEKTDRMNASIKGILAQHLDVLANSGTRAKNAVVLLGLMLLDHAKGRARYREVYRCTRMTLGQYLDAVETLAFPGDGRPWAGASPRRAWPARRRRGGRGTWSPAWTISTWP